MWPIKGFPNYLITDDGWVWSCRSEKWLKPERKADGYLRITLSKNGKVTRKYIHRLVLETYVRPCPPRMECRHLDGDRQNNCLRNLCWGTRKENSQDSIKHGTHTTTKQQGESNPNAKLTKHDVRKVWKLWRSCCTHAEIAELFGVSRRTIGHIVNGTTWRHLL